MYLINKHNIVSSHYSKVIKYISQSVDLFLYVDEHLMIIIIKKKYSVLSLNASQSHHTAHPTSTYSVTFFMWNLCRKVTGRCSYDKNIHMPIWDSGTCWTVGMKTWTFVLWFWFQNHHVSWKKPKHLLNIMYPKAYISYSYVLYSAAPLLRLRELLDTDDKVIC